MAKQRRQHRKPRRTLPLLDGERPAAARLVAQEGPAGVMASTWRDPDDTTPTAARTPRQIHGYRTYCPLRRCRDQHGDRCAFTDLHIAAADELRRLADAVMIGFGGKRDLLPIQSITYGPRTGPSMAAIKQAKAWPAYRSAMAPFASCQRDLIAHVLLMNWSLTRWVAQLQARGTRAALAHETGKLVACLDILARTHETSGFDS